MAKETYVQILEVKTDDEITDEYYHGSSCPAGLEAKPPLLLGDFLTSKEVQEEIYKLGFIKLADLSEVKKGKPLPLFMACYSNMYGNFNLFSNSVCTTLDETMARVVDYKIPVADIFILQAIDPTGLEISERNKKKWNSIKNKLKNKEQLAIRKAKAIERQKEKKQKAKKTKAALLNILKEKEKYWPADDPFQLGTKVRTIQDAGSKDWVEVGKRRWGVEGHVINRSDAHGLCYEVIHDNKEHAWYEPGELAIVLTVEQL